MSSLDAPKYDWVALSLLSGEELSWLLKSDALFAAVFDVKMATARRNIRSYSNFTWTEEDALLWRITEKLNLHDAPSL